MRRRIAPAGVPDKPEAWLLTTARRRLIDVARHARVHADAAPALLAAAEEGHALATLEPGFPDEWLELLFVCAGPAIDAAARTPLMLQTVLGLDAAPIASPFLVKPSTMGQRLTIRGARASPPRRRNSGVCSTSSHPPNRKFSECAR